MRHRHRHRPALAALAALCLAPGLAAAAAAPGRFGAPQTVHAPVAGGFAYAAATDGSSVLVGHTVAPNGALGPLTATLRDGAGHLAADQPLPQTTGSSAGPVVAAAPGIAAVAWRQDSPKHYSAIQVALREGGAGTFASPLTLAGPAAGGVRHPAIGVAADGRVLAAWNTAMSASHLNAQGRIAIATRAPGGAFGDPVVVTATPADAPAVAGADVVAWTRRRRVEVVGVDRLAGGSMQVGKVATVGPVGRYAGAPALAETRAGQTTIAWIAGRPSGKRDVMIARRSPGGHVYPVRRLWAPTRFENPDGVRVVTDGADRVLVAWQVEDYSGHPRDRGYNGIYARELAALSQDGGRSFGPVFRLSPLRAGYTGHPAVALAPGGTIAAAWAFWATRADSGIEASVGRPGAMSVPQRLAGPLSSAVATATSAVAAGAGPGGATAVFALAPPPLTGSPVLAADAPSR